MSSALLCNVFEDKKCRVCGLADTSNVNIFHDQVLQKKITTVYPILLLPDDPLPKNICRKCINNVSSVFRDIQRVIKLQTKWTRNVRLNDPKNNFLQTLDLFENATAAIKNIIIETHGTVVSKESISRKLKSALSELGMQNKSYTVESAKSNGEKCDTRMPMKEESTNNREGDDDDDDDDDEENIALSEIATSKKSSSSSTPSDVGKCQYCPMQFESLEKLSLHQSVHLRVRIYKIFQKKFLNKKSRRGRLITINQRQSIRCLNCWRIFDDNKCILDHWSKAECDFYCQICGEEFEQSPKMLREHVSAAHGISYKLLKVQRDHITKKISPHTKPKKRTECKQKKTKIKKESPASLKSPQVSPTKVNSEVSNCSPKTPPRNSDLLVKCRICSRTFQSFKACNSHMRAHKPPYAYGEGAPLPDVHTDAYMEVDPITEDKKPIPTTTSTQNPPTAPPTNQVSVITEVHVPISSNTTPNVIIPETPKEPEPIVKTETPCSQTSINTNTAEAATKPPTSTAPRGIRMKFVNRRRDLNGSAPNIKVKSLSDLQGGQQQAIVPHHLPRINEVQNVLSTSGPEMILNASFNHPKIKYESTHNIPFHIQHYRTK